MIITLITPFISRNIQTLAALLADISFFLNASSALFRSSSLQFLFGGATATGDVEAVEDEPVDAAVSLFPLLPLPVCACAPTTAMPIRLARCHSVVAGIPCDSAALDRDIWRDCRASSALSMSFLVYVFAATLLFECAPDS